MAEWLEPGDLVRYQEPGFGGRWFEARLIELQPRSGYPWCLPPDDPWGLPGDDLGWLATVTDPGTFFVSYQARGGYGRTVHLTGDHLILLRGPASRAPRVGLAGWVVLVLALSVVWGMNPLVVGALVWMFRMTLRRWW